MEDKQYSRIELMEAVNIKHRPTFLYNYLQPAILKGFIELTIPDKPTSSQQQYFLTQKREITLLMSSILFHLFDTYSKKMSSLLYKKLDKLIIFVCK